MLEIQQILAQVLPPELSYPILEYAGYPPPVIAERNEKKSYTCPFGHDIWRLSEHDETRGQFEDHWHYLETDEIWGHVPEAPSTPDDEYGEAEDFDPDLSVLSFADETPRGESLWWLKEVTVTMTSRDQGWSETPEHRGTYNQSYTWFDIAIKRPVVPGGPLEYLPGDFEIQRNKHAYAVPETHTVTLPLNDPFFQRLRAGDVIVLLAKAKFPVSITCASMPTMTVLICRISRPGLAKPHSVGDV